MACSDANRETFTCAIGLGAASSLCAGAARLHDAPCKALRNSSFLLEIILSIGLTPDARGSWLYGNASRYQVSASGFGANRVGLWQEPLQLSAALAHLARSAAPVLTYMEVGVFSGWTSVVMSAFLSRLSNRTAFRAAAVDIDRTHLSLGTSTLLARHKASFIFRHRLQPWLDATPLIDLCFIGNV